MDGQGLDFRSVGLGHELVDYLEGWELQRVVHAEVAAGSLPGTVLELEHAAVYTAGRRTEPHERPRGADIPVVEVDRGGKITWHGPGQLVVYPIVRLPEAAGVVDFVRRLEEAMIALFAGYGLATGRVRGRSGVWLAADPGTGRPERKIAAIGVRVAAGTTMHGMAVNVAPSLAGFDAIVPCGLSDVGVTTLAAELAGPVPDLVTVAADLRPHLRRLLAFEPYVQSIDIVSVTAPVTGALGGVTIGLQVGAA